MTSSSRWVKCIADEVSLRAVVIQATPLVQELSSLHRLRGDMARALGEAVVGSLMVSSYCKSGERVNLSLQGGKRISQVFVDADADGVVRGYLVPKTDAGAALWEGGVLSVLRSRSGEKGMPYIGHVPVDHHDLSETLNEYWHQSEQVPTVVSIHVEMADEKVIRAGGVLAQAMPGADPSRRGEREIEVLARFARNLKTLSFEFAMTPDVPGLLGDAIPEVRFRALEEKTLSFACSCSMDKVQRALILTGEPELRHMIEKDRGAVIHCDFCTKEYRLSAEDLEKLIQQAKSS